MKNILIVFLLFISSLGPDTYSMPPVQNMETESGRFKLELERRVMEAEAKVSAIEYKTDVWLKVLGYGSIFALFGTGVIIWGVWKGSIKKAREEIAKKLPERLDSLIAKRLEEHVPHREKEIMEVFDRHADEKVVKSRARILVLYAEPNDLNETERVLKMSGFKNVGNLHMDQYGFREDFEGYDLVVFDNHNEHLKEYRSRLHDIVDSMPDDSIYFCFYGAGVFDAKSHNTIAASAANSQFTLSHNITEMLKFKYYRDKNSKNP